MKKCRFKKFGPFSYFRVKKGRKNFISAWLTNSDDNLSFGWECGTDGEGSNPSTCIRINNFNVFSFESFEKNGFTLWILGFWYTN